MKSPVDLLLEQVQWREAGGRDESVASDGDLPWVTHEGILELGEMKLRCYRLSSGQAVLHADDVHNFFGALSADTDVEGRGGAGPSGNA